MATDFKFSDLSFQRDSQDRVLVGPQHGVALVQSLPAVGDDWLVVMPTLPMLHRVQRIFPGIVGAYEIAVFNLCLALQEVQQLRQENDQLRKMQEADAV